MKLAGYIIPFKTFMFAVPCYTDGKNKYFHETDENYKIIGFYYANHSDDKMIKVDNNLEFTKGSNGAIVFAGEKGHIIVDNYKLALQSVDRYLTEKTKVNEYLNVKGDLEYFKNLI